VNGTLVLNAGGSVGDQNHVNDLTVLGSLVVGNSSTTITGNLSLQGGTLQFGQSPSDPLCWLVVNGSYQQDANSTLKMRISSSMGNDVLSVGGNVQVDGTWQVTQIDTGQLYPGDIPFIYSGGAVSGTFAQVVLQTPLPYPYQANYSASEIDLYLFGGS
jgi:hypothetical protein